MIGAMKRVVSYSLFQNPHGTGPGSDMPTWRDSNWYFTRYAPALVRAHHACFEGWELRIHHDESIWHCYYGDVLLRLHDQGLVNLVARPAPRTLCEGMLWRMLPAWDGSVDRFITRDVDSLPTPRDRQMVEEWIAAGHDAHVIHDSTSHTGLMGGTAGYIPGAVRLAFGSFEEMLAAAPADLSQHGADQILLGTVLQNRMGPVLVHTVRATVPSENERPVAGMGDSSTSEGAANRLGKHVGAPVDPAEALQAVDVVAAELVIPDHMTIAAAEQAAGCPIGVREPEVVIPLDRAILACSLNPDYAFFLPFDTALWRRLGYRATIFLVGTPEEWSTGPCGLAAREARKLGAELRFVPHVEGRKDSTVAQCVRAGAGALPEGVFRDTDYALVTDADLWPLDRRLVDLPRDRLGVTYANAYQGEAEPHYPMCHQGAPGRVWRQMVAARKLADVAPEIFATLPADADDWASWNHDERELSRRIYALPGPTEMRTRYGAPPVDRLDRSAWPRGRVVEALHEKKAVDAHLPRPGQHPENWPDVRALFLALLPGQDAWVDAYHRAFTETP